MTAFGEGSIQETVQPWIFSSKRFDPESGFYYFGRRYYSPCRGRFITPDPSGFEDGHNLYAYVHNNPLIHVDPDGQFAFLIPFVAQIGVCYAMEMALPYAVTELEAYGATTSTSLLGGVVHGFTGEFEWSALGSGSKLSTAEKAGLAIGMMPSPKKILMLGGALKNFAMEAATGAATSQVTSWFAKGTARAAAQETTAKTVQKTTKVAVEKAVIKERSFSLDALSKAGQELDRNGLTKAGRALDKHGNRINSVFPKATGNVASKNLQGQYHLDDILTNPQSTCLTSKITREIKFYAPDGRGAALLRKWFKKSIVDLTLP